MDKKHVRGAARGVAKGAKRSDEGSCLRCSWPGHGARKKDPSLPLGMTTVAARDDKPALGMTTSARDGNQRSGWQPGASRGRPLVCARCGYAACEPGSKSASSAKSALGRS